MEKFEVVPKDGLKGYEMEYLLEYLKVLWKALQRAEKMAYLMDKTKELMRI
jgi:hypothetical protein